MSLALLSQLAAHDLELKQRASQRVATRKHVASETANVSGRKKFKTDPNTGSPRGKRRIDSAYQSQTSSKRSSQSSGAYVGGGRADLPGLIDSDLDSDS